MVRRQMSDRYRIIKKIGQGGAGSVYLAEDTSLDRRVAIKKLRPATEEDDSSGLSSSTSSTPESLFQEAKALSAMQHPNIVTVFDIAEDEEGPFVVMEYLSGETLERTIRKAPLPLEDFFRIGIESLEALSSAHRQGILHRDIKPSNLMLVWDDAGVYRVKILDFGLAKFTREPSLQTEDQTGSILGTIHFMAPEQFERRPLDQRTDLYSLGCVLYRTLTQRYPFDGESAPEVMASHLQHRYAPITSRRSDLAQEVIDWIERMMGREPEERFAGSEEALQLLKDLQARYLGGDLAAGASSAPSEERSGKPTFQPPSAHTATTSAQDSNADFLPTVRLNPTGSEPRSGSRAWVVWAVSALLLVGAGAFFFLGPSSGETRSSTVPSAEVTEVEDELRLSPFEVDEIAASEGEQVTLEGVVKHVAESRSGRTRYLNFSWPPGDSVPLAISITPANETEFSMGRLEELSGKA
ncbi:MAG: serine/threonine-protein kinase, partial [Verrucomicrobiota bacterium]